MKTIPPDALTRDEQPARSRLGKGTAAIGLLVVIGLGIWFGGEHLRLAKFVQYEDSLRQLHQSHPVLVYCGALLLYVAVTGLSIPAATPLSLLYAWYFGFWRALVVVSFGSTSGATVAFLISRFFLRDWVRQRFKDQLSRFERAWEQDGAYYLLTLRLLPMVPFFVVNAVMALLPVRVSTFWWASQLGMLPGTMVYVYAGSTAPDLRTLAEQGVGALPIGRIVLALSLLGLLPWGTRWVVFRWRRMRKGA